MKPYTLLYRHLGPFGVVLHPLLVASLIAWRLQRHVRVPAQMELFDLFVRENQAKSNMNNTTAWFTWYTSGYFPACRHSALHDPPPGS